MPRYSNSGSVDQWVQAVGLMVPALGYVDSLGYLQGSVSLPTGITIDNSVYTYDPIILSQKITGNTTVVIPTTVGPYQITIQCTAGEVGVYFNNQSNTELLIPATGTFVITVQNRIINQLVFAVSSGTAYLTVRKA